MHEAEGRWPFVGCPHWEDVLSIRAFIAGLMLLCAAPAFASDTEVAAERYRLEVEMDRLAQRTAWTGVERTYAVMLGLQVPLSTHTHYTAALAAEARGDILEALVRLERGLREGKALEPPAAEGIDLTKTLPLNVDMSTESAQAAKAAYVQLSTRYGRVELTVDKSRLPALVRVGEKLFSKTEREAIERGQEVLVAEREYSGLLPIGKYMVDGEFFEIKPGELSTVTVKKR